MTRLLATRRDALDLQALLDGERPSSAAARARLQPLAALAGSLAPREVAPDAEFVAGLRARLLAEAADRPVTGVPAQRSHPRTRKVRRGVAVVTALGLLGGAGAALASTRALPGDELYGLKRGIEHVQLSLAHGDVGRGSELLDQAEARLGEAQALAAGENSTSPVTLTRLSSTLQQMATADEQAVTDLTRAYDETGDASVLTLLDRHLTAQLSGLADLTSVVAPQVRRQAADLADRLARLDTAVRALLGGPALADAASVAAAPSWGEGPVLDARRVAGAVRVGSAGDVTGAAGAAGAATGGAAGVEGVLGAVSTGGGSGGATGGSDPVSGVTGSLTGTVTGTVGGVLGGLTGSSSPTPAATSSPTSTALVTDPVGTVTSAVPLPTLSPLPSVSLCVPVPPLTSC